MRKNGDEREIEMREAQQREEQFVWMCEFIARLLSVKMAGLKH